MKKHIQFYQVAGITIEVTSDFPISKNTFHPKFNIFKTDKPGNDNVKINHHFHLPKLPKDLKRFERFNDGQWRIYKTKDRWIYKYKPFLPLDPDHRAIAIFSLDHTQVDIYTVDFDKDRYKNYLSPALTFLNSDQILFSKLLCDRKGLIIHSNGFDINGQGILLVGQSGAGKSTLSQMLKQRGHKILCDDRMFIIKTDGVYRLSGHWCHGSVPDVSNLRVPLKAIFFLEQALKNEFISIQNKNTITQNIIQALVKSFLDSEDWNKMFLIIEELVKDIKSYRLKFDLSGDVCYKINQMMSE
ncbi:MAG: hypothetical protein L3J69_15885 [Desulfobacula sp.]|nr:hypothetical protein [Desulfobacula sp.]